MKSSHILAAAAAAALIAGGPALAQGRGGGHGGGHGQGGVGVGGQARGGPIGVGVGARGGVDVGVQRGQGRIDSRTRTRSRVGIETRERARANSQGPAHANPRAIERANENSVLRSGVILPPNLTGLRTGLVVRNRAGAEIGTVSRIVTDANGRVTTVLVDRSGRRGAYRLAPGSLTVDGDVVVTSSGRFDDD